MTIIEELTRPAVAKVLYWDQVTLDFPGHPMDLLIASDGEAVTGVRFGRAEDHSGWLVGARRDHLCTPLEVAAEQLRAYARGEQHEFDVPLRMAGTPFQLEVWQALLRIGYGTTSTYGEVARKIGRPGQARAIGAAVGSNPVGIIVPCHRVVGADGSLTGFGGGLANKEALLSREGFLA